MRISLIIYFILFVASLSAQDYFSTFNTHYDDSFAEWNVHSEEEQIGSIELKWKLNNDWTQWRIDIGEYYGTIQQKWDNNPGHWELRINGDIIDIKTVYPRDYSEWRIKKGDIELRLKSKYRNIFEDWSVDDASHGYIDVFTTWEGDVRDWSIEDGLEESIELDMKIAIVFIAIYHSIPKF